MEEQFKLHIQLGNEAMQTPGHIADALRAVGVRLDGGKTEGHIFDTNGNRVGFFFIDIQHTTISFATVSESDLEKLRGAV